MVRTPGCVKWRFEAFSCEASAFSLEVFVIEVFLLEAFALEVFVLEAFLLEAFALEVLALEDFVLEDANFSLSFLDVAVFPAGLALAFLTFALVLDRPSFEDAAFWQPDIAANRMARMRMREVHFTLILLWLIPFEPPPPAHR